MNLETFVDLAKRRGASDVHLEPGLPVALRVDGWLTTGGEPIAGVLLTSIARGLLGDAGWQAFTTRGSADVSRTVQGARCRINVFRTMRGTALAVRLLATFQPTLARLNLLPELQELMETSHGLVIVTGPTGAGKSSTIAALIQKINETDSRHVVTIEDPIEYYFAPRKAFIRQREVGRDTPSFAQGLQDSLREDPDVLLVGEMRDPETMRLTLNAAETGRLVLTTLHSASVSDALQRLLSAFPAEHRPAIQSQLADCLRVIVAQRLRLFPDVGVRAPECEILRTTHSVRSIIRQGHLFKLISALETGAADGQWSFERYRSWLENRTSWFVPSKSPSDAPDTEPELKPERAPAVPVEAKAEVAPGPRKPTGTDDVIVIQPPRDSIKDILSELGES